MLWCQPTCCPILGKSGCVRGSGECEGRTQHSKNLRYRSVSVWFDYADIRCSVLIDASRQELYEFQTLDWNSIAHSTVALRKTTLAVLSFAEACPEVS